MAKAYSLRFMFRDRAEDLIVPVRKAESDRLEMALFDARSADARFFVFDTLEGRTYALNLAELQAVRFLWDPSVLPPDSTRDEGTIEVVFRGRAGPLEVGAAYPQQIAKAPVRDRAADVFAVLTRPARPELMHEPAPSLEQLAAGYRPRQTSLSAEGETLLPVRTTTAPATEAR